MSVNPINLLKVIEENYSLDELKELYLRMDVEFNSLEGGEVIGAKARALIMHLRRRKKLPELVDQISDQMPHIDMTEFGGSPPKAVSRPAAPVITPVAAEKEYVNFDVRIYDKRGDVYPVEASYSHKGGAGTGTIEQNFNLADPQFQDLFMYLEELVAERDDAKAFGAKLRQLLFPYQVWSLFNTLRQDVRNDGKGVRIRLRIDPPELSRLPWEYCYDDESRVFFAKDLNTPLVRYFQRPFTPESLETISPLKILMVTAGPSNYPPLNMEEEEARIRKVLSNVQGQVAFEVLHNATPYKLQRTISNLQPHVLHFIGHGEFKDGEGALLLEDEQGLAQRMNAEQMADLMRNRGVKLVVLNACQTAASAEGDAFMGVAPSLVLADVPAVIAMQFAVPDATAIRFTQALYDYLTLGKPLDTAVTEMRISASNGPTAEDQVLWAIPVLFMRSPDGVLWKTNRPPVRATAAVSGGGSTAGPSAPDLSAPPVQPPPVATFNQGAGSSGGVNFGAGGNINMNVGGDFVSGDKSVRVTNINSGLAGGPSLSELLDEIAAAIQPHLSKMDDLDAEDLKDYVADAQKSIRRDRYGRAQKKLEDALELVEDLDDDDLTQKIEQAIVLAKQKA